MTAVIRFRQRLWAATLATGILLAAAACAGDRPTGPGPDPAPLTADLTFVSDSAGSPAVYARPLTGGATVRLLSAGNPGGAGALMAAVPSHDGARVAFVIANYAESTGDVFVANRDGTDARQLTVEPEMDDQPGWSPSGQWLAVRSWRGGYLGEIWLVRADGTDARSLTPNPLPGVADNARPAWSPDGSRVAYASTAGGSWDLWVMRADGSDKRRLTAGDDADTEPVWAPDGRTLAFRRVTPAGRSQLALVDASAGLSADGPAAPRVLVLPGAQAQPAWSPDGALIAFVLQAAGRRPQIATVRPDGSELTVHTGPTATASSPGWLRR